MPTRLASQSTRSRGYIIDARRDLILSTNCLLTTYVESVSPAQKLFSADTPTKLRSRAGLDGGSGDEFEVSVIAGPASSGEGIQDAARLCSARIVGFAVRAYRSRCVIHSRTSTKLPFLSRLVSNCHHTTSKP